MNFTLGEINIVCTNLSESRTFYCDILNFLPGEEEDGALHLTCQETKFLLLPIAQNPVPAGTYTEFSRISFDLTVPNIRAAYDYFQSKNVNFEEEWQPGKPMFIIRDPDGNCIEIVHFP